jgi:F0F1-type ATP synthase membrane subunit c/vacuolar-type H+-ATPase subunit K
MNGHVPVAQQIARGLPMLRILWAVISAASVGMFVVSRTVEFDGPSGPPVPTMGPTLFVVGLMMGAVGVYLPRAQLVGALKRRRPTRNLLQTCAILGLALSESMAFIAVVMAAVHVTGGYALPLFVLSWLLLAARFPTLTRPLGLMGPALDLSEPETAADAIG